MREVRLTTALRWTIRKGSLARSLLAARWVYRCVERVPIRAHSYQFNENARTVVVVVSQYAGNQQFELPFAKRMAAAVLVTLPFILLVLIFQRKIIAGLTAGAVKG